MLRDTGREVDRLIRFFYMQSDYPELIEYRWKVLVTHAPKSALSESTYFEVTPRGMIIVNNLFMIRVRAGSPARTKLGIGRIYIFAVILVRIITSILPLYGFEETKNWLRFAP